MDQAAFQQRLAYLQAGHESLITRPNAVDPGGSNGVYERYRYPVLTAAHTPLFWRYDLNPATNPTLMERLGINAVFNPVGEERVGDVSNVAFCNGWVCRADSAVLIYYATSDTRSHVITSTVDRLLDYVMNTPEDGLRSAASVAQRVELIRRNLALR